MDRAETVQKSGTQARALDEQKIVAGEEARGYARMLDWFLSAEMDYRARLKACLRRKSVLHGDFELFSGQKSSYYIDCKLTTLDPEGAVLTAHAVLEHLERNDIQADAIGGPPIGAHPIVAAVAAVSYLRWLQGKGDRLSAFLIREKPKAHGCKKQIEGIDLERISKVVIVDEVCTTGKSTLAALDAVESAGLEVAAVVSLVDREQGGSQAIRDRGYKYIPIFTAKELLEVDGEEPGAGEEAARDTRAPITVNRRSP
jgi:orotate phosphoribosyltransferase